MKLRHRTSALLTVSLIFPLASALQAAVVALPYSNDFTSSVADFTETNDPNWVLDTGAGTYEYFTNSQNNAGTAMVTANGLGATHTDFVVSTTFTVTTLPSGSSNWGMALLGEDESPSDFILVDIGSSDALRIINIGGTAGTGNTLNTSTPFAFDKDISYTITATGTYSGSDLTLDVDIINNSNSANTSITSSAINATTAGYDGSAMGLRSRSGSGGGTSVLYDSFSIAAIPEPSTYVLLAGFAMLGFVLIRRRR